MAHSKQLNTFHLFAGAGGGILADLLLGHAPIGACEIEHYPRNVLLARQADGILPTFPVWDDVGTLDGNPWRGSVDVLCGGFPCQDISLAGKGAGISGERSGLWKEYARLIGEMRPKFVFAENSPQLRTRGLVTVLQDLDGLGYNARWCVLGGRDIGAPHERRRMWILAYAKGKQSESIYKRKESGSPSKQEKIESRRGNRRALWKSNWTTEPAIYRVVDGVADQLDRLKAIGNGQIPSVAAMAFNILSEGLTQPTNPAPRG